MRAGAMCLSVLRDPKCLIPTSIKGSSFLQPTPLATLWSENFHASTSNLDKTWKFKLLGCSTHGVSGEGLGRQRWKHRSLSTKVERINKGTLSSNPSNLRHELLDETVKTRNNLNVIKPNLSEFESIQYCDVEQNIVKRREYNRLVPVFVLDIETTGFSRENDRIIEIAIQHLLGGQNSTFQTLVNPERIVLNSHVHRITTRMVNRPDVPRMEDLIPILMHFIRSRHNNPELPALFVAHNARCFDVPFLIKEFSRCSIEIPPNWLFLDTLPLARQVMKLEGSKLSASTQEALRKYYDIPLEGSAHRAMADVRSLALILQKLTFDLKLPISDLLERSFKASDLTISKKKKKNNVS